AGTAGVPTSIDEGKNITLDDSTNIARDALPIPDHFFPYTLLTKNRQAKIWIQLQPTGNRARHRSNKILAEIAITLILYERNGINQQHVVQYDLKVTLMLSRHTLAPCMW
ncbi:26594_t:CDS:2, partial [Dentiscutata erythropus]